jgi:hypothetical protein
MPTEVISRLRQALPRLLPSSHAAGGSLLVRLRSTSFALCGAATAVGLGLVALAVNQGWPDVLDNAIPAIPKAGIQSARIAGRRSGEDGRSSRRGLAPAHVSARRASDRAFGPPDSSSEPGRHLAVGSPGPVGAVVAPAGGNGDIGAPTGTPAGAGPPTAQQPAAAAPQPAPAPAPAPAPTPVSSPSPPPAEEPPAEESSSGHGKAKGHEKHEGSSAGESPPPVKEKHSHGPPPPPVTPVTDPTAPAESESPAPPKVPPGHAKASPPGQGHGNHK